MTGETDSSETKEEYQNKRKGWVKLLEIYHHLHQQGQVSTKIMHTVLVVTNVIFDDAYMKKHYTS